MTERACFKLKFEKSKTCLGNQSLYSLTPEISPSSPQIPHKNPAPSHRAFCKTTPAWQD